APVAGLSAVGRDAQSVARVCHWGLRQSRECAAVDARLREGQPAVAALRGAFRSHLRDARLHAGLWPRSREPSRAAHDRLLHQPRSAAAWLRAGADARGFDPAGQLVRDLGPYGLGGDPRAPARSAPCVIRRRRENSSRTKAEPTEETEAPRRPTEYSPPVQGSR